MQYRLFLSSAIAASVAGAFALPQSNGPISVNNAESVIDHLKTIHRKNMCGPNVDKVCDPKSPEGGPCCSQWGFCGNRPEYCGPGCLAEFSFKGQCKPVSPKTTKPEKIQRCGIHAKNKKCPDGQCCSANGYCGTSINFCGISCQDKFGVCHKQSDHSNPTELSGGRCGQEHNNRKCGSSLCCSHAGYCGKGPDYCSVPQNCQRQFGWCDNMAVPMGYNTSMDARCLPKSTKVQTPILKCAEPHTIALTFDDGPTNYTNKLLDLLKQYKARGTFFLGGNINGKGQIDLNWNEPIRRMVTEGHQVASHSWSHPNMTNLPTYLRRDDMIKNERAIANVIGKYPTFMRAPYISCDTGCQKDMNDLGYYVANWQWDSEDWRGNIALDTMIRNFDKTFHGIKDKADGNLFVIQHDSHDRALKLTKHILESIKATRDWKAVPLVECLGYSLDDAYRYPTWLEPAKVLKGACLVSGVNYCITVDLFKDKKGCFKSVKHTEQMVKDCENKNKAKKTFMKPVFNDCDQANNIAKAQRQFCNDCGTKQKVCDTSRFNLKAWQPKF